MWCSFYRLEKVLWQTPTWFCHKCIRLFHIQIASKNVRTTIIRWLKGKTSFERHHRSVGFMTAKLFFKQIRRIIYERSNESKTCSFIFSITQQLLEGFLIEHIVLIKIEYFMRVSTTNWFQRNFRSVWLIFSFQT